MAFSFFKKTPEKMIARQAINPRSRDGNPTDSVSMPDAESVADEKGSAGSPGLSGFVFSRNFPGFQIEAEIDPVEAEAQDAAVLFANEQDEAVRTLLENAVRIHRFGPGERLWLMLFDLYLLSGNRPAFEALEVEYARSFEKSPPGWQDRPAGQQETATSGAARLPFRGDLTGDNGAAFDDVASLLPKHPRLRLDLSGVSRLDAEGCGRLRSLMEQARKCGCALDFAGRHILDALVQKRIVAGHAENEECWLLYLQLCQLDGLYDVFEEMAVQFAVTFEVSPPSWEADRVGRAVVPGSEPERVLESLDALLPDDAYVLRGSVKALRFEDLLAYAELHDPVVVDCSQLVRIDFISAGALLNSLATICRGGNSAVFRHPNRLVAELFGVVGLTGFAKIVFAKH